MGRRINQRVDQVSTGYISSVTAGDGLSGGGSSGAVTLAVDANELSSVTGATSDYMVIEDVTDNSTKKALISDVITAGDITSIVTAGTSGLAGGATSGDVTLTLNLAGLTAAQALGADGSGVDLTLYTTTAGDLVLWDASDKSLEFTDSTITMNDNEITTAKFKDYGETVNAIGSIGGGTQDIDMEDGNVISGTVDTGTTTFTFSNPSASGTSCSFTLFLTNGGSQTVNWPASVDWAGSTAPTLTTAGVDILTFITIDGGTIWNGFAAGLDMK